MKGCVAVEGTLEKVPLCCEKVVDTGGHWELQLKTRAADWQQFFWLDGAAMEETPPRYSCSSVVELQTVTPRRSWQPCGKCQEPPLGATDSQRSD